MLIANILYPIPQKKTLVFKVSKDVIIPQYLYYFCEHLLNNGHKIKDWEEWSVQLVDIQTPIKQLKSMEKW